MVHRDGSVTLRFVELNACFLSEDRNHCGFFGQEWYDTHVVTRDGSVVWFEMIGVNVSYIGIVNLKFPTQ